MTGWQSTFHNPALYAAQPGKITVGLPGVTTTFSTGELTFNDVVVEEGGRQILDVERLAELSPARNTLRSEFDLETLGFSFRGDRFAIGVHHRIRNRNEFTYPRELLELVARGNGAFIGQTVEIAPAAFSTTFHEFALGGSYAVTDNVHFGARLKLLSGVANLETATDGRLALTTGEDNFALTLDADYLVNATNVIEYNGLDDTRLLLDLTRVTDDNLLGQNTGLAFDFGVYGDFDRLRFQVAASDLGATIEWREAPRNYEVRQTREFTGLDALTSLLDDEEIISFEDALDSLETAFEPTETRNDYTSGISGTVQAGGELDFTDDLTFTAFTSFRRWQDEGEFALALGARYRLFPWLTTGANYNFLTNDAANIGLLLIAEIGPVHLLATTDDVLTVFSPRDATRASVRLGAALQFGGGREEAERR